MSSVDCGQRLSIVGRYMVTGICVHSSAAALNISRAVGFTLSKPASASVETKLRSSWLCAILGSCVAGSTCCGLC